MQKLRDRTQSTGFKIIVAVLVFTLAFFGFGAFNVFAPGDPEIASVNGEEITLTMVQTETDRQRRRIMLQFGDQLDPDAIDPLALQESALEQLIARKLLEQAVDDLGLQASRSQVDEVVTSDPNFQIDGRFNESLYKRTVSAIGYSAPQYLEETATQLSLNQLREAVFDTALLPLGETRLLNSLLNQQRDIAYLAFTVEHFSRGIEIARDEIQIYFDEHTAEFHDRGGSRCRLPGTVLAIAARRSGYRYRRGDLAWRVRGRQGDRRRRRRAKQFAHPVAHHR